MIALAQLWPRPRLRRALEGAFASSLLLVASPAAAEAGATASVWSEEQLRGYSLSAGRPVGRIDLSYDHPTGVYGALSASAVYADDDHLQPFGLHENVGFAKSLSDSLTLDLGLHNANYTRFSSEERAAGYTEAYVGLIGKTLSAHVYVSPNYFYSDTWRGYGELEASFRPLRRLQISAHVGASVALNHGIWWYRPQYDWRIGAAQEVGRVTLHANLSGGGPDKEYYDCRVRGRTALVVGASYIF